MPGAPDSDAVAQGHGVGVVGATALGVGGMIGAGLFTMLGLAAQASGGQLPLAIVIAGMAAGLTAYSYAQLSARFPSRGGSARFVVAGFGQGVISGALNTFQFIAYAISLAMCARSFGEYLATAAGGWQNAAAVIAGLLVLAAVTVANLAGAGTVTTVETAVVAIELALLIGVVVVGFAAGGSTTAPVRADGVLHVIAGAALMYTSFQGFAVITNASGNMARPQRTVPLATVITLTIVALVYLGVAEVLLHRLSASVISANATHVLATLGSEIAGHWGLLVVSGCALLANASVLNSGLFGAGGVAGYAARAGQLPARLARPLGRNGSYSTVVTSSLVAVAVCVLPLQALGEVTTLMFLLVYAAITVGHLRIRHQTGARAWVLVLAVVVNAVLFGALLLRAIDTGSTATVVTLPALVVVAVLFQVVWQRRRRGAGVAGS